MDLHDEHGCGALASQHLMSLLWDLEECNVVFLLLYNDDSIN